MTVTTFKPKCNVLDIKVYSDVVEVIRRALRRTGDEKRAKEFSVVAECCDSLEELILLAHNYVEVE